MRIFTLSLLVIGLSGLSLQADQPAPKSDAKKSAYAEVKAEYDKALKANRETILAANKELKAAQKAADDAKSDAEKKEAQARLTKAEAAQSAAQTNGRTALGRDFAKKFLAVAQANPKDPTAFDCVKEAMNASSSFDKDGCWPALMQFVQANFANKPEVKQLLMPLSFSADDKAQGILREVMTKHPDRKVQVKAYKAKVQALGQFADIGEQIKDNAQVRSQIEKVTSKEFADKLSADFEKNRKDAESLEKEMHEKFADIIPDLSVGKPVPDVSSKDVQGNAVKLSDLKGKVVVLDIWATWCGPCKAMIPHEREMVEKLKDKPFVLVSVSADDELKTLTDFLAKEKMPWTHWWNGAEGGIIEEWDIDHFPTVFVLDTKGIIRHKEIRGEELEKAVNELIKEAQGGK